MAGSCSLTPPYSPSLHYDVEENHTKRVKKVRRYVQAPCFTCKGVVNADNFINSSESYLKNEALQKLLENEPTSVDNEFLSTELYGMLFSAETAIFTDLQKLFAHAKKHFCLLQMSSLGSNIISFQTRDISLFKLRQEICNFLVFLKISLQKLQTNIAEKQMTECSSVIYTDNLKKIILEFLEEYKSFLFVVGRISDLPDFVLMKGISAEGNSSTSPNYHLFHLCLDIWWSTLEILHIVHSVCYLRDIEINLELSKHFIPGCRSLFSQGALLVIWDLCFISLKYYKEIGDITYASSPFSCSCVREFWVLLINLLDKRHHLFKEDLFWMYFNDIVQTVLPDKSNVSQSTKPKESSIDVFCLQQELLTCDTPIHFCFWVFSHLAPLYKYNPSGEYTYSKKPHSCYFLAKRLVESALSTHVEIKDENHLRSILCFCIPLIKLWESRGDILLPLIDFYLKKIDDTFYQSGFEVKNLTYLFKTSMSWFTHIMSIFSSSSSFISEETSFHIYLHILSTQIASSGSEGNNLWRQLKGRIYSKVHSRRLRELSEAGLQNCFSIFFTIACAGQLEDASEKICELINILETPPVIKKKQMISWKALFTLIFIYKHQNKNPVKICSKIAQYFYDACNDYLQMSNRCNMQKHDQMNLLLIYLDNVQTMFEDSTSLMLSEYILVGSGFSVLLPACDVGELNSVLGTILIILSKLENVIENNKGGFQDISTSEHQHEMLFSSLCKTVLPFVKNCVITVAPPTQLSDIAAAFTIISYELSAKTQKICDNDFISLFKYFGTSENVNNIVMCRYLCFVLHNSCMMDKLKNDMPNVCELLMQSWLKCSITLVPPCNQMEELTKLVFQLKEITEVFPDIKTVSFCSGDHSYLTIKFLRIMGDTYKNLFTIQQKTLMRHRIHTYFRNFATIVTNVIKQGVSNKVLHHVYNLCGHLFEYCAPLLYVRSKPDCPFPLLLDVLVLPHMMFSKDKPVPQNLLLTVKEHLPLFIQGLAKLDYANDPYIKRKFKDIINHYLSRFTVTNNPLLNVGIDAAVQKSQTLSLDFFNFLVEGVRDQFLVKKSPNSPEFHGHAIHGIRYFNELLKHIPHHVKLKVCGLILSSLLDMLLFYDNHSHQQQIRDLTQKILELLQKEQNLNCQTSLVVTAIQNLIESHLAFSTARVFKLLHYIAENQPSVIHDVVPFLSKSVESVEQKRGVGPDQSLRRGLKGIIDKLQKTS